MKLLQNLKKIVLSIDRIIMMPVDFSWKTMDNYMYVPIWVKEFIELKYLGIQLASLT